MRKLLKPPLVFVLVAIFVGLSYLIARVPAKVDYCYIERYGSCYELYGARSWALDRDLGCSKTLHDLQYEAKQLQCQLELR